MEVERLPLLHDSHRQRMMACDDEGVANELPAIGIDEQRGERDGSDDEQMLALLRRPGGGVDEAPAE